MFVHAHRLRRAHFPGIALGRLSVTNEMRGAIEDKNDRNDAKAICEAVARPSMRFVAVKSVEQQDMLRMQPRS
jgi:transposase